MSNVVAVDSFTICKTDSERSSDYKDVNMTDVNKALWTAQVIVTHCVVGNIIVTVLMYVAVQIAVFAVKILSMC